MITAAGMKKLYLNTCKMISRVTKCNLKRRSIHLPLIGLMMLLALIACKEETPEPDILPFDFVGEWTAAGDDVATLFRMYPLNVDSIYIDISDDIPPKIYIEKYKSNSERKAVITRNGSSEGAPFYHTFEGVLFERPSGRADNILPLKVVAQRRLTTRDRNNLENDGWTNIRIIGIYRVDIEADSPEMLLEFVYQAEAWDVLPPTPEAGFGSTENGAFGMNNVHRLTKIIYEAHD